jgi:transcriptional regulator with XRE-family HTH domain
MAIAEQFGHNLYIARRQAGMTQGEVAAKVYVHQSLLSRWERGVRCPSIDLAVVLANALGVQVRDLLYGIGDGSER